MKKGVTILIIVLGTLFILGGIGYAIIKGNQREAIDNSGDNFNVSYTLTNPPNYTGDFNVLYSSVNEDCKRAELEALFKMSSYGKIFTQKFLLTVDKEENNKCSLKIKVLEYVDTYGRGEEFERWLVGKESNCEFEKEELTQVINGFEKYVNLEILVLDSIKPLLRQNCDGAFVASISATAVKKDSDSYKSNSNLFNTCIDEWCFGDFG